MEGNVLTTSFQLNVKGETMFGDDLVVSGLISVTAGGTSSKLCEYEYEYV